MFLHHETAMDSGINKNENSRQRDIPLAHPTKRANHEIQSHSSLFLFELPPRKYAAILLQSRQPQVSPQEQRGTKEP